MSSFEMVITRFARTVGPLILCFGLLPVPRVEAFSAGVASSQFGVSGCNGCHSGGVEPTVSVTGPTTVTAGTTAEYLLTILSPADQLGGGFNATVDVGTLAVGGVQSAGTRVIASGQGNNDATHSSVKAGDGSSVVFSYLFQAPTTPGVASMTVWGNAVNGTGSNAGDRAGSDFLSITVEAAAPAPSFHFVEYKVKESDKKAADGVLAKGCVVTLDDPIFSFGDGQATAENYEISKAKTLSLPADKNGEGGVDLAGTHLLGLQMKAAKQGALPVVGGRFPSARKAPRRSGVEVAIANPTFHDGAAINTLRLDVGKETRLLVPANKALSGSPGVPGDTTDYYKCYKAAPTKEAPFGSLQEQAKGKLLRNLQVVAEDQFGDGASHATYGDARLYDLSKVTEICNPVSQTAIDTMEQDAGGDVRTSSCSVTPASVNDPDTSMICFAAKAASSSVVQPWDGVSKGAKIEPKQNKHAKFSLKTANALHLGHSFTAPDRVDTSKEVHFCFSATVTNAGQPAP